jgi:ubiquinone/menaquinone biosynthesis C-methylase UbiE
MGVNVGIILELEPNPAFDTMVEELVSALATRGITFLTGPNGRLVEGGREIGRILAWQPGNRILLEWAAPDWKKESKPSVIELRFEPLKEGTRVTLDHREWSRSFDDRGNELTGWFAGEVVAPLIQTMESARFGDWITDRNARRPSGARARATYKDPLYHRPNFLAILNILQLRPTDYLLEVGCGGGAFLKDALRSGCRAAAIDHSFEMVKLASEVNREAIDQKRLIILEAEADRLPYPDATFTCAVMTGVFNFLPDPAAVLSEIDRVLNTHGRLVIFTGSKELRGTPAAPEPVASRLTFYEDDELEKLARGVGFAHARVERPNLQDYARQVGVPEEAQHLFSKRGGQFLIASKNGQMR